MKLSKKDVPTGVFILSGIFFIQGFYRIGFFLLEGFHFLISGQISPISAIIDLILGSVLIICGSWLISLKPNGRMLAMIISILYLLFAIARVSRGGSLAAGAIDGIIAAIILIYLNMPEIKKIFNQF
jgi:hypothetical protein